MTKKARESIGLRSKARQTASAARKAAWKQWLDNLISESEAMVQRCRNYTVKCPECREDVVKTNFVNHRTKRGCTAISDRIKMSNWQIENYI